MTRTVVVLLLVATAVAATAAAATGAGASSSSSSSSCYRTSNFFRTHFNDTSNVLEQPTSGVFSQVCRGSSGETCCGKNSDAQLMSGGKNLYDDKLQTSLKTLSVMYKEKAAKFDEYFKDMLTKARTGFHDMFKKTYGMMYEQNSYLFQDLFRDLEKYYDAGNTSITDVLENFFSVLCQKMFTVMNSQFTFDSKYLVCVSESMSEVAPFGDVPSKLSTPLKRSFVASRTYVQALKIAGDILANINKMVPTQECLTAFAGMTQCPSCKGLQDTKACNGYCLNVMKGCLAYHSQLDQEWNSFLEIMEKVKKRLLGPFNIELVVIPINVKISEGIMNFQENAQKVSQKVFTTCGKPTLGPSRRRRRRRDVYNGGDDYYDYDQGRVMNDGKKKESDNNGGSNRDDNGEDEDDDDDVDEDDEYDEETKPVATEDERKENLPTGDGDRKKQQQQQQQQQKKNKNNSSSSNRNNNNDNNEGGTKNSALPVAGGNGRNNRKKNNKNSGHEDEDDEQGGPAFAFHGLLKDIGTHVSSTKNFWKRLPHEVCNNEVAVIETGQNTTCWNGTAVGSYTREVTRDGVKNQRRNPEVPVDLTRSSSLLNEQMFALKLLTNKLKNAYQGLDVEWDFEEVFHGGESSGVGPIAFSGDGSDDEEDAEPPVVPGGNGIGDGGSAAQPPPATVPSATPATPGASATTSTSAPPGGGGTVVVKTATDNDDDDGGATDSGSSRPSERMLQKALAAYLLPVAAVWFGGSFLEWIL